MVCHLVTNPKPVVCSRIHYFHQFENKSDTHGGLGEAHLDSLHKNDVGRLEFHANSLKSQAWQGKLVKRVRHGLGGHSGLDLIPYGLS